MSNRLAPHLIPAEHWQPLSHRGSPALRVLVIEGGDAAATSLARRLRSPGFEVRVARDAVAVEAAQAQPPDVVFLDLGLPGMDGAPVSQWLGEPRTVKRPLLIALSGGRREDDQRRSGEAGVDLHLEKPVDFEVVRGLLRRFQAILH